MDGTIQYHWLNVNVCKLYYVLNIEIYCSVCHTKNKYNLRIGQYSDIAINDNILFPKDPVLYIILYFNFIIYYISLK